MNKLLLLLILLLGILVPGTNAAVIRFGAYDPAYWNGLVLLNGNDAFAFRFVIYRSRPPGRADGYDTFHIVERVGPVAPDGSFSAISFNPFLPFGRGDQTPVVEKNSEPLKLVNINYAAYQSGVVGRLEIPWISTAEIIFYNPWDASAAYRRAGNLVRADGGGSTFQFIPVDYTFAPPGENSKNDNIRLKIGGGVDLFYFYAGFEKPQLTPDAIDKILKENSANYAAKRPKISGQWQGAIASISNNLGWMKLYQPDKKRIYIPAGRRWIFPGPDGSRDWWTIFEWDAFFNALEAAVEDPGLAKLEIEAVLDTQYPTGNIPNWRSARGGTPDRSQPPVGSFAVLKTYYRTGDIAILANSYERLKKWHESWKAPGINGNPRRDGNRDGLLEWGSDTDKLFEGMPKWEKGASGTQRAAWESGQDDLPNYDNIPFDEKTGTLKMNCIDLSSLYALDTEMMMRMADILGKKKDARQFEQEYEAIKKAINASMWNRDFYYDRHWDGGFSTHKAASNFYPLIAGAVDAGRLEKLMAHLTDPGQFWGDYVIPTISRDNPAFKDQQYWRGTIWPPTNYLVYQGLKRCRQDKIAARFAVKSASLFLKSWQTYGLCRENYNSITGEGGGQKYQSWGPLFTLILLEEFIDVSPFDGLRAGNLAASKANKIENLPLMGHTYSLEADNESLALSKDGKPLFRFTGKAVLRRLEISDGKIAFEANILSDALDFYPTLFNGKSFNVQLDGKKAGKKKNSVQLEPGTVNVTLKR
jgi:hypothetical protein